MRASKAPPIDAAHWRLAVLLALATVAFMLALAPATMLWDRDEALYARTAVEMLRSGDFLLPTFNGATFAHKPPLIYWLMAGSLSVFGHGEFAVRLPSALGLAGAAFFTFLAGARLFGARAGLWAMTFLAISTMAVYLGSAAMLDAVLLLFVCAATWSFVELLYRPDRLLPLAAIFGAALALAQLTKGPVGPAVVVGTVLLTTLLLPKAQRPTLRSLAALAVSAIVSFAVFLAWAIPANTASGGALLGTGIGIHVIGRALAPMEGHGGSGVGGYLATLPVYAPVILIAIFPWILHFPATVSALLRREIGTARERAILWGWAAPTFVMFSLAATKLPHYIFPLMPAVMLAIAATVDSRLEGGLETASRWWLRAGAWIYGVSALAMLVAVVAALLMLREPVAITISVVFGVVCLAAAAIAVVRAQLREQVDLSGIILAIAMPFAYGLLFWLLVPTVEPEIKISRAVADEIRSTVPAGTPTFMTGYTEPSLVFYLDPPVGEVIATLPGDPAEAAAKLAAAPDFVLVATEERLEAIAAAPGAPGFDVRWRRSAINLNAGADRQTVVIARRGLAPGG